MCSPTDWELHCQQCMECTCPLSPEEKNPPGAGWCHQVSKDSLSTDCIGKAPLTTRKKCLKNTIVMTHQVTSLTAKGRDCTLPSPISAILFSRTSSLLITTWISELVVYFPVYLSLTVCLPACVCACVRVYVRVSHRVSLCILDWLPTWDLLL